MAGTDNSTVKITITVVDANSGAVISQTTKNLSSLGAAGKEAGDKVSAGAKKGATALAEAGEAGAAAGKKIAAGMGEAGAHTLTNLDKVRLLRDDLGIRIPRAMENVIARSSAASAAIGMIGSGLVALGAIEILVRLAEEAYELYQKLSDVNGEMTKYAQSAAQMAQGKLFDNASIETANALLQQTNDHINQIDKKRKEAGVGEDGSGAIAQYLGYGYIKGFHAYTGADDKDRAQTATQHDAEQAHLDVLQTQAQMLALQNQGAARSAALVGAAARQAKKDTEDAIAALKFQQTQQEENAHYRDSLAARDALKRQGKKDKDLPEIYKPADDAGASEYGDALLKNQEMAGSEGAADARKQSEETSHIQAEARAANLRGEQAYMAQRDEQLRQLKEKLRDTELSPIEYMKRVAAADEQYAAQRRKRIENENAETARMQAESAAGGQTGMSHVDADHTARTAAIAKQAPDFSDPDTASRRKAAEDQRYQQEQTRDAEQFTERLSALDASREESGVSATQRIALEAKRSVDEIRKAWQEMYGGLDAMDARRVQSLQAVSDAERKIMADAARQQAEVRQQLVDQTIKAEEEGSRRGLTREQEQTRAILDEYNERKRALDDLMAHDAANADLYRRQEIAAEEAKNGKLIEQEREMRDKLAGTIRGFMDNPLQALKKQGEEMASKQLADLLLKANHGQAPGDSHTGLFGMSFPGRKHGAAAGNPEPVHTTTSSVSAASTTLTAGTATIHIGSATFSDMPGSAGASVPAAAAVMASSSGAQGANVGTAAYLAGGGGGSASTSNSSSGGGDYGMLGADNSSWSGDAGVQNPGQLAMDPLNGGWTGSGQKISNDVTGTLDTLQSTTDSLNQAFGGGSSGSKSGSPGNAGASGSATNPTSSLISTVTPYASAGAGIYSAVESNGGLGGALQGGMAGMKLGSLVGGPIGAGIGLAAGAIIGFIGFGGAEKAAEYDRKQVRPRIENDIVQFGTGAMDYQSALQDLIQLDQEARKQTKQWGIGGKRQWDDHIHPEIMKAQQELTREQKAGRSQYSSSAAQFHSGGFVSGFGDYATSANEGWLHAKVGETVMHESATSTHGDALAMMLAGASRDQMAAHYAPASTAPASSSSGPVNLHFHSPDAAGTYQLFMDNKHHIRKALNASYAENSGGSDLG